MFLGSFGQIIIVYGICREKLTMFLVKLKLKEYFTL